MNAVAKGVFSNRMPVDVTEAGRFYGIGGNAIRLTRQAFDALGIGVDPSTGLANLHEVLNAAGEAVRRPAFVAARGYVAWTMPNAVAFEGRAQLDDCSLLIDLVTSDDSTPAMRLAA